MAPVVPSLGFLSPATINFEAAATDSDGKVVKVEFYANGILLCTDVSAPYTCKARKVQAGTHTFMVKAFDDKNAESTSAEVTIIVK